MNRCTWKAALRRLTAGVCAGAVGLTGVAWAAGPAEAPTAADPGQQVGAAGVRRARNTRAVVPPVTLSYRRVPLERVLDFLSSASGGVNIKISVDDEEQAEELRRMLVTVELANVNWRTAVEYLANKYRFVINDEGINEGILLLERPPRISLNVQNADIANVIKLIAAESGTNIIIGSNVTGQVSFNIHDVPWMDALESILKTYGYVQVVEPSGIIRITSPDLVQSQHEVRVVQLEFIQPGGSRYTPVLNSEYVTRSGGDLTASTINSLMAVLDGLRTNDGRISYEERSNSLVIKDTPTAIAQMVDVIRTLDREPLQVKINVRILTRRGTSGKNVGVNWANGLISSVGGGSWQTTFPFSAKDDSNFEWGRLGGLSPAAFTNRKVLEMDDVPPPKPDEDGFIIEEYTTAFTLGTLSFEQLQATLQAVQSSNDIELLQAPEVLTMDNTEATIQVGQVHRYAEFYVNNTDAGSESGYREAASSPVIEGVQLLVVPHVCGDTDKVVMEVVPKTEEFDSFRNFGGGGVGSIDLPQTANKVVVTKMMLRSTETGIIGGLVSSQETETIQKVPLLGDIPVIRHAFRNKSTSKDYENTLIFITPTILGPRSEQNFEEDVEEIRDLAVAGLDLPSAIDAAGVAETR